VRRALKEGIMSSLRRIRRVSATALLVMYLPGCHHWVTPKGMTPQEYVTTVHPAKVRVTLADLTRVELQQPWVVSDSLFGRLTAREVWAEPLASVQLLQVRKFDVLGTVLVPLSFLGVFMVACAASDCMDMSMQMDFQD
jgi:hypothetical protein